MKPLTVVAPHNPGPFFEKSLLSLAESALVERVVIVSRKPVHFKMKKSSLLVAGPIASHETVTLILDEVSTEYLLLLLSGHQISIEPQALKSMLAVAESTKAGLVYSDFYDDSGHRKTFFIP